MKEACNRFCPYCQSRRTNIVRVMGLSAFNIWDDIVCLSCGARWEKHSKVDKMSRNQINQRRDRWD